ncbi:SAM-dependent methyltransferase [Pseudomonas sp. HMWF032]|uniref:methyltransferase n=1 Tax=Pseudomonas sp. HMWF032 TaxID=2056866 RepID=UPI000D33CD71|nr:methyltransferase [Pseudomonas sp. HMWF032]PTS82114.1 SAM-dependent methyltransferase [Pseudomonas sp. HMWF032]PTT80701.1 SAM-dependent methyltransferase [Pseudomonas sp. HMWF010]
MPASSSPAALQNADLQQRFNVLDRFLVEHQALWRPRPFVYHTGLPWEAEYPQLATWLRTQSLEHAEAAHNQPHRLPAPAPFPQLAAQAHMLSLIGELPRQPGTALPPRLSNDVPGRKWQQIDAFARSLSFTHAPQHWLDWCAGKGHLGRRLAHDGGTLTCLEYDAHLVNSGQLLSQKLGISAAHIQQDVLAENAARRLQAHHCPVALHACGELHIRLLQLASQIGCQQLAFAPCCYNRINGTHYQALSANAQASALKLSIDDLGLPMSETVTAGARIRRQRDQSMARRLAFDILQRQLRGIDKYLPTPSVPAAWLDKPFADYCRDLATLKQLPAPKRDDWPHLEQQGWQRLAEVRNLELLRGLFRRPLELWLLLDRALFLQEQGYNVRLGTFCATEQSPRNLLLLAEHQHQLPTASVDNSVDRF